MTLDINLRIEDASLEMLAGALAAARFLNETKDVPAPTVKPEPAQPTTAKLDAAYEEAANATFSYMDESELRKAAEETPEPEAEPGVSLQTLRQLFTAVTHDHPDGAKATIKSVLAAHGASTIGKVKPEDYQAVYDAVKTWADSQNG